MTRNTLTKLSTMVYGQGIFYHEYEDRNFFTTTLNELDFKQRVLGLLPDSSTFFVSFCQDLSRYKLMPI